MKTKTLVITAVVAAVGIGALSMGKSFAQGPFSQGGYGPGYSMMQGQHGQGHRFMKTKGYGGANCQYDQNQTLDTPLTVDDVRANMEQHLKFRGNERLKLGNVTNKDDKTIVAEIVTVDDSLVRKVEIDKTTGRYTPVK